MASSNTGSAAAAASTTSNEVEETLARIRSHKGVEGVLIMTKEGASNRLVDVVSADGHETNDLRPC